MNGHIVNISWIGIVEACLDLSTDIWSRPGAGCTRWIDLIWIPQDIDFGFGDDHLDDLEVESMDAGDNDISMGSNDAWWGAMNKWLPRLRLEIWSSESVPATRVADDRWSLGAAHTGN
jgi:hypothetical protein